MAIRLPTCTLWGQSSLIPYRRQTCRPAAAVSRKLSKNSCHLGGVAHPEYALISQVGRRSKLLQAHKSWRGAITNEVVRRRTERCSARSSAVDPPLDKGDLNEQDVVNNIDSSSGVEALTIIDTPSSGPPSQATVRNQPQKPEGIGGGLKWILGPLALLVTGALPALWLSSPALFSGTTTTGLLALTGLDATFNMGATAFLLMANSCASSSKSGHLDPTPWQFKIPLVYKAWSFIVNLVGFAAPAALVVASLRGTLELQPSLQVLPAAALFGPYALLLLVQWVGELLVWRWRSPVWPVLPLIYQAYRILQLTRGLDLGASLEAPAWLLEALKGLVAWWVFVVGMQIMWIAWLVGTLQREAAVKNGS